MAKSWMGKVTLFAVLLGNVLGQVAPVVDDFPRALPFCRSAIKNSVKPKPNDSARSLVLISTLDGRVSALDAKTGTLRWSVLTGPGSMLSSSISKIEMASKGEWFRVIPSLDGGLYKFYGESIEAMPVTTDTLLSSSLKLADDVVMAGAKDSRVYGINPLTGKLHYSCDSAGCKSYTRDIVNPDDIILVRRHTHVVRAVDPKTGLEKWNYSVGRHEVAFVEGSTDIICASDAAAEVVDDDDTAVDNHAEENEEDEASDCEEFDMKVVTSKGTICAVSHADPERVVWKHQFDNPVLGSWTLEDGHLKRMDLFDVHVTSPASAANEDAVIGSAMLYVGVYQKQLYVQESNSMLEKVTHAAQQFSQHGDYALPRIHWKPYLVTAQSRTPYIAGNDGKHSVELLNVEKQDAKSTALMIRKDGVYPFDGGYFLFSEETPLDLDLIYPNATIEPEEETLEQIIIVSLWYWWKELLAIVIATLILNLFLTRHFLRMQAKTTAPPPADQIVVMENSPIISEAPSSLEKLETAAVASDKVQAVPEYVSRYLTDFEPVECLGRGGFGVVFHARNRIDDCDYAIKRICLPNRDDAREKVMREVKALAKLDHVGIVRYYNAWLECPPLGWQEDKDKHWEDRGSVTPSACYSSEDSTADVVKRKVSEVNPLNPYGNSFLEEEKLLLLSRNNNTTSSFGFIPNQDDESGSFSFEQKEQFNNNVNVHPDKLARFPSDLGRGDSFSVGFENGFDVPFGHYTAKTIDNSGDSFIVFEDSGCGDKSDNSVCKADVSSNDTEDEKPAAVVPSSGGETVAEEESAGERKRSLRRGSSTRPTSFGTNFSNHSHQAAVGSANAPKIYLHIQMQLCKKENLKDWLNACTPDRDKMQVLDFFDQIVSAVEYVHDQGLMHRDLKPSNIFFSMDGCIKVGDFGLVTTMAEGSEDRTPAGYAPFKKHTDQVGTQLYMSPEQMSGQSYSHKVDVFSLGLIFFELLIPFGTQMERLRVMVDVKKQTFPSSFKNEHPEELSFVQQMLSHDPEARPTATDIRQHSLLQAFQPRPEVLRHRRTRNLSRTYSTSSSGSGGPFD